MFVNLPNAWADEDDKFRAEYSQLRKYELLALKNAVIGKEFVYDLTHKIDCNKSTIKYLGILKTSKGKKYKVINTFFVYSTANSCRGNSNIKLFDMQNSFVGLYNVEMPYDLPVQIKSNKLICWTNDDNCNLRDGFKINFEYGLPKRFFLPCSKSWGKECNFISE
jgi:hypothetical protein